MVIAIFVSVESNKKETLYCPPSVGPRTLMCRMFEDVYGSLKNFLVCAPIEQLSLTLYQQPSCNSFSSSFNTTINTMQTQDQNKIPPHYPPKNKTFTYIGTGTSL